MGKLWVEVCLISARALRRSLSLWKLQWYAVGWTNPNNKYCTKIDASGNANPVWKTKFATLVEDAESKLNDLALHIEVYSREPIFLRERLQGTATIVLKEFLAKHENSEGSRHGVEEVGSYQLRKKNSNKPQGFVDVSIHISEDMESRNSYTGNGGGPGDYSNTITLATGDGPAPALLPFRPQQRQENQFRNHSPYANPMPSATNYSKPSVVGPSYTPVGSSYQPANGPNDLPAKTGPGYQPSRTPPRPPPPSTVGYIPTFLPRADQMSESYINMPSSSRRPPPHHGTQGGGPGLAMGMGAGALAAGAVIFGDDFMSGFEVPSGLQDASVTISTDTPF